MRKIWQNANIIVCNIIQIFGHKTKKNIAKTKLNDQLNKFLKDFLILKLNFYKKNFFCQKFELYCKL
jgi:hypothetical protein